MSLTKIHEKKTDFFMIIDDDFLLAMIREGEFKDGDVIILDCMSAKTKKYIKRDTLKPNEIYLLRVDSNNQDNTVKKCPYCLTRTTKPAGIVRGFYLGQDATTSVICDSLYEELPYVERVKIKKTPLRTTREIVKSKQLLTFSDNRQDAAFFASYFQYSHNLMRDRRYFVEKVQQYPDASAQTIIDKLAKGKTEDKIKAFLIVINELENITRNNLLNTGWINLKIEEEVFSGVEDPVSIPDTNITITLDTLKTYAKEIVMFALNKGAMEAKGIVLGPSDYEEFSFSKKPPVIQLEACDVQGVTPYGLITKDNKRTNRLINYFIKTGINENDARTIIKVIFEHLCEEGVFIESDPRGQECYVVSPSKLFLELQEETPFKVYRCSQCGRVYTTSINNKCPTNNCTGTLEEYDFSKEKESNYYVKSYAPNNKGTELTIKEHTAQLNNNTAKEYQEKFVNGDINILSCTTTFEMGVDVGELETVFMKNMPPKPANYIQRAGRAGRRLDSAAFALTFCLLRSHDFHYFNEPLDMIQGKVTPPIFKIDNEKIVKRHLYSALLSIYWKKIVVEEKDPNKKYKTIEDFLGDDKVYNKIKLCLDNLSQENKRYLQEILPSSLKAKLFDYINEYKSTTLENIRSKYLSDRDDLIVLFEEERKKLKPGETSKTLNELSKLIRTIEDNRIIEFYSRNNLIPKYGFPVDTVDLVTNSYTYPKESGTLSLQRDLAQAITEFAPGSEVIANGYVYTSRYIKKPNSIEHTWERRTVWTCSQCRNILEVNIIPRKEGEKKICSACGEEVSPSSFLIPKDGFQIDKNIKEARDRKPRKKSSSRFYYVGNVKGKEKIFRLSNHHSIKIATSSDYSILVLSNASYLICNLCGYAVREGENKTTTHKNNYGYDCKGKLLFPSEHLGHIFKTDAIIMSFDFTLPEDKAITLLETLLEGLSRSFDIERDDINGCLRWDSFNETSQSGLCEFILFDSVPGGAGNVKRISELDNNGIISYLKYCLSIVENCNCGDKGDGNAACYSCLCNYRNQQYHDIMKRKYSIELLHILLEDYLP